MCSFITRMGLRGGEFISFYLRGESPKLTVVYLNLIPDTNDEDLDHEDSGDDEGPLNEALYAQRLRLSDEESGNLWDILPLSEDTSGCHS